MEFLYEKILSQNRNPADMAELLGKLASQNSRNLLEMLIRIQLHFDQISDSK